MLPFIWWSLADCFVTDNLSYRLFGTVANDTDIHFCIYVSEIAQGLRWRFTMAEMLKELKIKIQKV